MSALTVANKPSTTEPEDASGSAGRTELNGPLQAGLHEAQSTRLLGALRDGATRLARPAASEHQSLAAAIDQGAETDEDQHGSGEPKVPSAQAGAGWHLDTKVQGGCTPVPRVLDRERVTA